MIRTLAYFKCSLDITSYSGALHTLSETIASLTSFFVICCLIICSMPCIGLWFWSNGRKYFLKMRVKILSSWIKSKCPRIIDKSAWDAPRFRVIDTVFVTDLFVYDRGFCRLCLKRRHNTRRSRFNIRRVYIHGKTETASFPVFLPVPTFDVTFSFCVQDRVIFRLSRFEEWV